jgi:ATP-dependent RNA helicase DDX3X
MGHVGIATSFYCDKDEPLASVLTRTLLETNQEVPDFLQSYIPEGDARTNLKFEADSDFDEGEAACGQDDAWGTSTEDNKPAWGHEAKVDHGGWDATATTSGPPFGKPEPEPESSGW